jgi:putative ABC transport system permease protein
VRTLDILKMRWRSLAGRQRLEDELDDELRFHFEQAIERYLREGMSPQQARRRARVEYGGPEQIKEECRQARGVSLIENVKTDVAYAFRGFAKNPGFALTAIVTLAIGIGINTALFTVIYAAVFRPLPVSDPGTIRNIHIRRTGEGRRSSYGHPYTVSFADFRYLRAHAKTIEIAAVDNNQLSWRGHAEPVKAQLVSDNLLPMVGARPVLGRFFAAEEVSEPGSAAVVVLSHRAWQRWFGGALDVAGRPMILNRTMFTIIGVADQKTTGPLAFRPDVWIPATMQALTRPGEPLVLDPTAGWLSAIGRRRPGYSDDEVRAELAVLAQQAVQSHTRNLKANVSLAPGALFNYPFLIEKGVPVVGILFLAVSLVLLVACANVANMLLARGLARRQELAIRLSIGAGRWRLIQQLLTESVLLAVAGGAAGIAIAWSAGHALLAAMPAEEFAGHQFDISPDARILLYTVGVSVLTGLVFGLLPALNTLRVDLTPALKSAGLEGASRRRPAWLQNVLLGGQAAAGMILLLSAGLLLRGFERALSYDTGLDTNGVLVGSFDLRPQQYTAEQSERFMTGLRDRVAALPGIEAASLSSVSPLISSNQNQARVIRRDGTPGALFSVSFDDIGDGYFATYGIRVLRGRIFTAAELREAAKLVVIDERLAERQFGAEDPIGRRVRFGDRAEDDREVIGVVASTRPLQPGQDALPGAYLPMHGLRFIEAKLIVRHAGAALSAMKVVEHAARELDPTVTPRLQRMEDNVAMALMPVRMAAAVAGILGSVALILACAGIYGVVSFAVNRRRREVGIRMALGAGKRSVLGLMLWQGLKPVLAGAVAGMLLGAAAGQLIRNLLYGLSALDPISFLGTATVLVLAAGLAAVLPARAAMGVDPALTLRYE